MNCIRSVYTVQVPYTIQTTKSSRAALLEDASRMQILCIIHCTSRSSSHVVSFGAQSLKVTARHASVRREKVNSQTGDDR